MPKLKTIFRIMKIKKKKKPNTIEQLLETTEVLEKKSAYLERRIEDEAMTAKAFGTRKKRLALEALRRKKHYEKQLQSVVGALNTVKFQLETLQSAKLNKFVLSTMQSGAKEQKKAHRSISPNNVHTLFDDIADQKDLADEINNLFTGINIHDEDEDALWAELQELEKEELEEILPKLPNVPEHFVEASEFEASHSKNKALSSKQLDEGDDVTRLEAWAEAS